MNINHIAVLGGGAWGTALAQTCARAGRTVTLWEFDTANAEHLIAKRESRFLPGVKLQQAIAVTRDLAEAACADAILLVVPAQAMRAVCTSLAPLLRGATPLIACAKGIERGTHKFMTEVIGECAPGATPAILSGPSFAADVARGLPTAVTLAAKRRRHRANRWRRRSARPTSAPIIRRTCAASRSAAPPRTCWRSPPASSPDAGSGPAPPPP